MNQRVRPEAGQPHRASAMGTPGRPDDRLRETHRLAAATFQKDMGFAAAQPILRARETMPGLLDHIVGAHEKCFRDRESERLRGGEVDDQIEPGWLLNRDVGRPGAAQNLIDDLGSAPVQVR